MRRKSGDMGRGTRWASAMACTALVWVAELGATEAQVSSGAAVSPGVPSGSTNAEAAFERTRKVPAPTVPTPALEPCLQSAREGNVFAINVVVQIFGQQTDWQEFSHWGHRRDAANADYAGDLSAAFTNEFQRELESAMAGDPFHQLMAGALYAHGVGTRRDYGQAAAWYRLSAGQENLLAQAYLGWMCEHGLGVPRDPEQARRWYGKGARDGNALARHNLALMLLDGRGGKYGSDAGIDLLTAAAEQGAPESQFVLGLYYFEATGSDRNPPLARIWFSRAVESGHEDAAKWLQLMDARYERGPDPGVRRQTLDQAREVPKLHDAPPWTVRHIPRTPRSTEVPRLGS